MKRLTFVTVIFLLLYFCADAWGISVKGKLRELCSASDLDPELEWQIVSKRENSKEIWFGIANLQKESGDTVATLAYGPLRCDKMYWLERDRTVVAENKGKYSLIRILDNGKTDCPIKSRPCLGFLCSGNRNGDDVFLTHEAEGRYVWLDSAGKVLEGAPSYSNVIISNDFPKMIQVKTDGKWGLIDKNVKQVFSASYDTLIALPGIKKWGGKWEKEAWYYVEAKGKWGLRGANGEQVLPTVYKIIKFWWDLSNMLFTCKESNLWGIVGSDGEQILPEEYELLEYFPFEKSLIGNRRVPTAILARKNGLTALLNKEGKELIPFGVYSDNMELQLMFFPQNSFSVYMWNKYRLWQKGEYETAAEFEARKKDPSRMKSYVAKLLPAAEKAFIAEKTDNGSEIILSRYDAESGCFLFSHNKILQDTYRLRVPVADAPQFKEEFPKMKDAALATAKYFIDNDMLALDSITFKNSEGNTYEFENPASSAYFGPEMLDFDLLDNQ